MKTRKTMITNKEWKGRKMQAVTRAKYNEVALCLENGEGLEAFFEMEAKDSESLRKVKALADDIARRWNIEERSEVSFTLKRVDTRRMKKTRRAAVEMHVIQGKNHHHLWMTKQMIEANMADWGPHEGLVEALEFYNEQEE